MESADKLMVGVLCSGTAWNSGTADLAGNVKMPTGQSQGVGVTCGDDGRVRDDEAAVQEPSVTRREHCQVGSQCLGVHVGQPLGG